MKIATVHFIGSTFTLKMTEEDALRLMGFANSEKSRNKFILVGARAFRPSSIDYFSFSRGEDYDLTVAPGTITAMAAARTPQIGGAVENLPEKM